jgi:membrane dipeptidase
MSRKRNISEPSLDFFCDAHVDTLSKMLKYDVADFRDVPRTFHVTPERLRQNPPGLIVLACFTEKYDRSLPPPLRTLKMIDMAYAAAGAHADWMSLVTNHAEFQRAHARGKMAVLLSIENGIAVEEDIGLLRVFHRLGVRMMSLAWNHRNRLADGIGKPRSRRGLTQLGREVLAEMERLGMLIDVSHLNERSFWDVMECATGPVVASHSNAFSIRPYPRNLTDAQIKAIAERKGFIGLNFCSYFLKESGLVTIKDIIKHARRIAGVGGPEVLAIGSDFDGISDPPAGLKHIGKMPSLLSELSKAGFSPDEVKMLSHENFLRVFKAVCG